MPIAWESDEFGEPPERGFRAKFNYFDIDVGLVKSDDESRGYVLVLLVYADDAQAGSVERPNLSPTISDAELNALVREMLAEVEPKVAAWLASIDREWATTLALAKQW